MECARPCCDEKENRVDGYCSEYCRDIHERERVIRDLLAALVHVQGCIENQDGDMRRIVCDAIAKAKGYHR